MHTDSLTFASTLLRDEIDIEVIVGASIGGGGIVDLDGCWNGEDGRPMAFEEEEAMRFHREAEEAFNQAGV